MASNFVKLIDYVRVPGTEHVVRLEDLIKQGHIEFRQVEKFFDVTMTGHPRRAWFADMKGTQTGWRLRKTDYLRGMRNYRPIE